MHAGKIDNKTAAARVFSVLHKRLGEWVGGWDLTVEARTTAVSTRISEVRTQLPDGMNLETRQEGHQFFYRLSKEAA